MLSPFLQVGKILNVHGIAGELKFEHWCDSPAVLSKLSCLFWDAAGQEPVRLLSCRAHGRFLLLKLEGIRDPETARLYKNRVLYASRQDLPLEPGRVFIQDLIGLPLIDQDSAQTLGTIREVVDRGAGHLYLVKLCDGREEYFPAVKEFICRVDLDKGVFVRVPKGLFDKGGEV